MKILVDADRLHEVITKAVDLKHQFENNSKLYEMASYITGNLSSMWFNGTQEVEQASIRATQGLSASLNDTMERLEKAANNWKPSPEGHITDEDREWADREIEKHQADISLKDDGDLTKEVLSELLLVIGEHSHPNQPIICRKAWELYGKLTGQEVAFDD